MHKAQRAERAAADLAFIAAAKAARENAAPADTRADLISRAADLADKAEAAPKFEPSLRGGKKWTASDRRIQREIDDSTGDNFSGGNDL